MEFWSTYCPECGWEGSVPVEYLIRGCPRKGPAGKRCGTPFATMPPVGSTGERFERYMTDAEAGESKLIREWLSVQTVWVRNDRGRLLPSRSRPVTWTGEEGDRKAAALWAILTIDPFPQPEGTAVRFEGVGPTLVPDAVLPPKREKPKALPPAEEEPAAPELDEGYFAGLVESEPPPERGRGP